METKKEYIIPQSSVLPMDMEDFLCTSPFPGENEDIGYEEWA